MDYLAQVKERCLAERTVATRERYDKFIHDAIDPWHKHMLTVLRDHWWSEIIGDVDATMATLVKDPVYQFHGGSLHTAVVNTTEAAREMYASLYDAGYYPGGVLENMRIACADWGVVIESDLTSVLPGAAFNLPNMRIDPALPYQSTSQAMQSQPFDRETGLMKGEIVYLGDITEIFIARR
ncbi:hypothetical protein [Sphingobium sp. CFD-1]|jgi:hypothetical protein|uniref:hypothetical protein n=1 Tax=Sphingobium sp. CFD-1 TaxID=2878545 RepID=UPI00214B69EC|nr:hypothetical protein [Sphingobium sp. CFD-1]